MGQTLRFYEPTVGGRDVVEKFLKTRLKKLPAVRDQLVSQLKILAETPIATLRATGRLEHVQGELLSFRFRTAEHWIRLLVALTPTDSDIVILVPLIKQRNKLDRDDIDQAHHNLRTVKARQSSAP